jgi:hypothetical protein
MFPTIEYRLRSLAACAAMAVAILANACSDSSAPRKGDYASLGQAKDAAPPSEDAA